MSSAQIHGIVHKTYTQYSGTLKIQVHFGIVHTKCAPAEQTVHISYTESVQEKCTRCTQRVHKSCTVTRLEVILYDRMAKMLHNMCTYYTYIMHILCTLCTHNPNCYTQYLHFVCSKICIACTMCAHCVHISCNYCN